MLTPDTIIQSRYRIVKLLGRGGMGAVYEAIDERLGRRVALKQMLVSDEHLRLAFAREAKLLANLRHPSLPNVIDWFDEGGNQFIAMEYIAGDDLERLLVTRNAPFAVSEVLGWADELLDALTYLHAQTPPIIHRDIKPANLKLTSGNRIILLDFGLAKGSTGGMTQVANELSVFGYTQAYAPLEQIQGEGTTATSDLYSLAASLYHLLSNRKPIDALTRATRIINDTTDSLPSLHTLNPQVPIAVSNVIMRALSLKPAARFATANEMREALRAARHSTAQGATAMPLFPSPYDSPSAPQMVTPMTNDETLVNGATPVNDATLVNEVTRVSASNASLGFDTAHANHQSANYQSSGNATSHNSRTPLQVETFAPNAYPPPPKNAARKLLIGVIFASVLASIGLLAFAFVRYANSTGPKESAPQPIENPLISTVPENLRGVLPSLATLNMRDANGKSLAQASGFFIAPDQVVTSLSALQGATEARVRSFDVEPSAASTSNTNAANTANTSARKQASVNAVATQVIAADRALNLAILKLNNARGSAATTNAGRATSVGERVHLIGAKPDVGALYIQSAIRGYRDNNLIEVAGAPDAASLGGVAVDDGGTVIGAVTSLRGRDAATATLVTPVADIIAALRANAKPLTVAAAGARDVLFDFRNSFETKPPAISDAERERVLNAVKQAQEKPAAPNSTTNAANTNSNNDGESFGEAIKNRVQDALEPLISSEPDAEIIASAQGSFTAPNASETAYLIDTGDESQPQGRSTIRLAVFNQNKLVANFDAQAATGILKTTDLNGDALNELILIDGYTQMGETAARLRVVEARGGKLKNLYELKQAYRASCGTNQPNSVASAAAIFYANTGKGKAPDFRADFYTAPCAGDKQPPAESFRYVAGN